MKPSRTALSLLSLLTLLSALALAALAAETPNIIFIMSDDQGYGDVSCLNPDGKIHTPGADKLAREGMIFTDAHSGSSVCTPTRYGLLTGRYSWRSKLQSGVVTGWAPNLIAKDRTTVASLLQAKGYHTGIVGKWHLNYQYLDPNTGKTAKKIGGSPAVGSKIPDGPLTRGFDYFHGFHHARDMKAVSEGDTVIAHDEVINMLPRLHEKSVAYIDERAKNKQQPFFLYVPLGSPHTPIVPTPEWTGKSKLNKYGDFTMQTDDVVTAIDAAPRVQSRPLGRRPPRAFHRSLAGQNRRRQPQRPSHLPHRFLRHRGRDRRFGRRRRRQRQLPARVHRPAGRVDPRGRDPPFDQRPLRLPPRRPQTAARARLRRLEFAEGKPSPRRFAQGASSC